jgi:glucuronate isomerase
MSFIDEDYLLESEASRRLYAEIESAPVLDPHSHVDLKEVVENEGWSDIWEVEGATDHYVWSLMRQCGVPEEKITGSARNREKWLALAEVFPEFAGNPTYEWIHLDLKRQFGIDEIISAETAESIWDETKAQLQESRMRPQALLEEMNVEGISSTDDPVSQLEHHQTLSEELDGVTVRPTWRPDRAMKVEAGDWTEYVGTLGEATETDTSDLGGFLDALETSHDYFDRHGCGASDHGLREMMTEPVSRRGARTIYDNAYAGENLTEDEIRKFKAFVLDRVGEWNSETEWVTQFHIGAVRNYRESLYEDIGADSGGDVSTQDIDVTANVKHFLNRFDGDLDVVLYTVDPTHFPSIATIARAFPNVSLGAAWWFNDSPYGMEDQLEYVGSVDLLSNYAGMVSDSRKLVSFGSRFEMFRRSLANTVGKMVSKGQIPDDVAEGLVQQVAYDQPKELWNF